MVRLRKQINAYFDKCKCCCAGLDSSVATGYTVLGSHPGGRGIFSVPVQTVLEGYPNTYTMGTGQFMGGKAAGAWRNLQPLLAPRLKKV